MSKRPKDPDAFERKVRPIYDALDSRNWKGALKLCQQALQKYPDNELIKVLKAIGLVRSGKREEANQVVDEVLAVTPTDEQVLRLSAMVLRASGRLPDITRMYEAAAAAVTLRGGELALVLQHEVFGAHVREQNFVKQQQVALRLSKAAAAAATTVGRGIDATTGGVSSERYGWWVVLSILLQARAGLRARSTGVAAPAGQVPPAAMEPEKMLALAEGMVARQVARDGRLEGYEALMVYVDILLAQGKTAEALSLASGPLGASALRLPAERLQLRAVLSALSGDLEAASDLLREGLALNPDDWGALLLLLDCMLPGTAASVTHGTPAASLRPQHPLIRISGGLAEQLPARGVPLPPDGGCSPGAFSQAEAVLRGLVEMGSQGSSSAAGSAGDGSGGGKVMTMRGTDLALVDLASRRRRAATSAAEGGNGDSEAAVIDAVLSYYRKYGSLVSCAVDLRTYVSQLSTDAGRRLAEALQTEADAAADVPDDAAGIGASAAALASLRRRVCAAQIRDDLGLPRLGTCEEGVELSKELLELYGAAQPLQAGLDERERGVADELPVLAAAALATSAALADSDTAAVPYMLAAYGALADAVCVRPYGAAMRISMAALAALLAAPAAAAAHIYKLDIKHIQMDTLGAHLLLPPLLTWPNGGGAATTAAEAPSSGSTGEAAGHSPQQQQQLLHKALRDTQALFDDHARDAGESLFTAYGHGMYTKVLEFTAFQERLAAAHTLALVQAEGGVLDCLRGAGGGGAAAAATGIAASAEGLVAADVMRTAALAAAGRLKPDSMPSVDTLRFNWDLATRPTWLPPCTAGPSAAVVEWWDCRARGEIRGQGYGRCWWSSTGSAEGSSPSAAHWRGCQAAATAHRWLLPHCIAGALGGAGSGVLSLREAVGKLAGLMGEEAPSPGGCNNAAAAEAAAEDGGACTEGCTVVGPIDLRRLDVRLYSAAAAVQGCLDPVAGSTASGPPSGADALTAAAEAACTALGELTATVRRLVAATAAALAAAAQVAAAWGGVLPGGPLAVMSLLVREQLPVAACCLQSWQATLKVMRKRKAKAGAGASEGASAAVQQHLQLLGDAVAAAAGELAGATGNCAAVLTAALSTEGSTVSASTAAEQAVQFLKAQGHAAAAVSHSATSSLESLIREQRLTVASIARQAAVLEAFLG